MAALMLLLCACADKSPTEQAVKKNDTSASQTSQEFKSSIFGRNVKYDGFTPSESISLPIETSEIKDMLEIGMTLYFLTDGAVYYLNIETGESGKLFDTDARVIAVYGESLYTYTPEAGELCEYSSEGELVSQRDFPLETEKLVVEELYVTDDYFDFECMDKSGSMYVKQHHVFDKNTLEKVNTIDEKNKAGSFPFRIYTQYKGNSILKVEDDWNYHEVVIYELNLGTGKYKKLTEANVYHNNMSLDFCYNPKTDTVIFTAAPIFVEQVIYGDYVSDPTISAMYILEYSLSDPDNIVQQRFYPENPDNQQVFVSIYENVVSAVTSGDNKYRYFNYLNPPESITLACQRADYYENIIGGFEKKTGIMVRTVSYGTDVDRLDVKLMAGDTDFDLFEPIYMHQHKYFLADMFEDLSQYEGLKQRLDGDIAAGYVSNLDGKYIGIPTSMQNIGTKDIYPEDGSMWTYSNTISRFLYLAQNIDIADGVYKDSDGEELYKLLRYLYNNPNGNEAKMPFGKEINVLSNGFILMNPNGIHKENSVKFLEYFFDALNGDIEGIVPEDEQYLDIESTDDVYLYWRIYAWDYVGPIYEAANSISQCDGKNSTIKEIARKAAAEVRMRIQE